MEVAKVLNIRWLHLLQHSACILCVQPDLSGLQAEQVQLNAEYVSSKTSGGKKSLTRDRSSSLVIMTTVAPRCSHTMRQKSPNVSGNGPCNEATLALSTETSKRLSTEMRQCWHCQHKIFKLLKTEMRHCRHCQQKPPNFSALK